MSELAAVTAGAAAAAAVALLLRPRVDGSAAPRAPGVRSLAGLGAGVAAALVVGGSATVAVLCLVVAGVVLAGRSLADVRRRRRRATLAAARVLETCELIASELAGGRPADAALRRAAEEWPHLRPAAETAGLGGDLAATLTELAREPGAEDLRLVAGAWSVAHRTGGGLADALERVASAIRGRRATRRVVESELASARATARLVAALPVVMLLLGSGDGGGAAWRFLTGHPAGLGCLALGLALGFAGLWWIERIADEVAG